MAEWGMNVALERAGDGAGLCESESVRSTEFVFARNDPMRLRRISDS
jgi:hypothetical protein